MTVIKRGFPIPLLKTISRMSNRPFHASQKIRKQLHVNRKNHFSRKNAKAKSCVT